MWIKPQNHIVLTPRYFTTPNQRDETTNHILKPQNKQFKSHITHKPHNLGYKYKQQPHESSQKYNMEENQKYRFFRHIAKMAYIIN